MRTLYKKNSSGTIQFWKIELVGDSYRTITGIVDTDNPVTSEWTTAVGKNKGRKNATGSCEQANLEVHALIDKKLKHSYYDTIEKATNQGKKYFEPMLAKNYEDYPLIKKDLDSGWWLSQPKLDGIRCIYDIAKHKLYTRLGNEIVAVPHILDELKSLKLDGWVTHLDGELYNHQLKENFNKIVSLVKKQDPTLEDLKESRLIQYHVYDCIITLEDKSFIIRTIKLKQYLLGSNIVQYVETKHIDKEDTMNQLYQDYILNGYEGQIIRNGHSKYQNKRTKDLLKRKEFDSEEFTILDIEEGEGNRSGMAGTIIYDLDEYRTFRSGISGGESFYKEILKKKKEYIGGQGTVRFFGRTPAGVPRFPVTVALFKTKRDV